MRKTGLLATLTLLFIFSLSAVKAQFVGGNNDGASGLLTCSLNLNGGNVFSVGPIVGSTEFCPSATEAFSTVVAGGTQDMTYVWSVPLGATIVSGQGTNSVLVSFGSSSGNVRVDVSTSCASIFSSLPVTAGACDFFKGGNNDGFSAIQKCASNLNGGSVFIPGPIVGSSTFCNFATETYSITVGGTTSTTVYAWTVPTGATIVSGQGTNSILVTFGNTNGSIDVAISNACETINVSKPVTADACTYFLGGVNDGYSDTQDCASNLNGGSVFIPGPIVGSTTFCNFASEAYSITVAGSTPSTTYTWSVPAGATITSGQGTNTILVTFGNTDGNISVAISNACETVPASLAVSATSCIFYAGGDNDGFSIVQDCISSLNGGSAFIPGPIVGSTTFCNFASETYSITVAGSTPSTVYNWTVPVGATITSGQGTNTILVTFGNTAGNVSVDISNECETVPASLAVSPTSCIFYAGGNNDGFSDAITCISSLNGTSAFVPGPIVGSTTFCNFASESYTINVAGANASTTYVWSVPSGATITSGQGTPTVLVSFGTIAGNVSVNISNACETVPASLAVSPTSCIFYTGGVNDGFAFTLVSNIPLPIELEVFEARLDNGSVKMKWATASEFNNDFFTVERSRDGESFEKLETIAGAGTSSQRHVYTTQDDHPLNGASYYRLRQTDFDGTTTFSNIVLIEFINDGLGVIALYPNPVENSHELTIEYASSSNENIRLFIFDVSGRVIQDTVVAVKEGANTIRFTTDFETAGVYLLRVQGQSKNQIFRLIVK